MTGVGTLTVNANGSYSFTPAANYTGAVPVVTYTVSDGSLTDTATLTLGITAVNDAPVAADDTGAATEDAVLAVNAAAGLLANDTDLDGPALSITQFTVAGNPTVYSAGSTATLAGVGTLTVNANGSYSFTPAANYTSAVPVVTYTVSDGSLTDTATLTLGITAVNDAPAASGDTGTATEDNPLSVSAAAGLLANDVDLESSPLSLTQFTIAGDPTVYTAGATATLAGVGTLTVNANGSYSFTPAANYTGAVPVVTYTVSDGSLTDTATLALGISAVNDAPVATDDTGTVTEDTVLSVGAAAGLLANDTDVEASPLTVTQFTIAGDLTVYAAGSTATLPAVGTLTVNADGSYSFMPSAHYTGPVPVVTYTVSDGGLTDTGTLTFGITAVNDAPVASDDTATVTEDNPLSVSAAAGLLANDMDIEGAPLAVTQFTIAGDPTVHAAGATATLAGVGTLTVNANGSYSFTPAVNYIGPVPAITYTVSDSTSTDTGTLTLGITPVDDAPLASDDTGSATEDTVLAVSAAAGLLANDTDVEGSPLSITQFTVAGDTAVYAAGAPATLAGVGILTVNADGSYTFTPAANYSGAVPVITYTVSDGSLTDTATLALGISAVNDAPVAADDTGTATEDTVLAVSAAAGLLANDTDVEGSPLSITQFTVAGDTAVYAAGATATLAGVGALTVNADGSYTFTSTANYTGPVPVVTYTVSDGNLTDTATLALGISAVNDAPVAADDTGTATEDTVLAVSAAAGLLANHTDVEGSPLSITQFTVAGDPAVYAAGAPATLAGVGILSVNADGSYTFTPAANYTGAVPVVTYTVSDGSLTDTATLALGISAVNDAPVAIDDTATATEDTVLAVDAAAGLLANDTDVEGSPLSITQFTVAGDTAVYAAGAPATLAGVGALTVNADGSYTFTPAANYTGPVPVVTYTVSDGSLTDTATLALGISAVNDAPVAADDTATATEDTVLSVDTTAGLLANDTDVEGSPLSITQFTVAGDTAVYAAGAPATLAGVGALTVNADGSYTFTPAANYTGAVPVVTYTVSDGSITDTATLALGISAVNDAPVAADDTATATEDTVLAVDAAAGLLANDTDVEGSPLSLTQFTVAGDPAVYAAGATATLAGVGALTVNADGSYTFTPAANYTGPVPVVTYTVSDGSLTDTATLALGISAVNDAPVAADDTATATEDTVLAVDAAAGLLANDTDVEGSPLSLTQFTVAGDPAVYAAGATATIAGVGALTVNADGSYTFTPAANYSGAVPVVTYTVSDGSLTDTATLALGISAVNDAPVAADDTATATEDTVLTVDTAAGLLANDTDVEGSPLSITQFTVAGDPAVYAAGATATLAGVGTLTVNADGSYTFTPAANYTGPVPVVTYTVSDGNLTDTATLALGSSAINDAPVATDDTATATEDTVLAVDTAAGLLANDTDVEGSPLSITQFTVAGDPTVYTAGSTATLPGAGTLTINTHGSYTFTPAANHTGAIPVVTYTVSDGNLTDTAALTLDLLAVNDAPGAIDDTGVATEDTPLSVSAAEGLLGNDTDVEGQPLAITQFTVEGDPTIYTAGATATLPGVGALTLDADGSYRFSPATNHTGAVPVITYTVSDGSLTGAGTTTATLTLGITAVNDAPVPVTASVITAEDTSTSGALAVTDPDGDPLTATLAVPPAQGQAIVNPDGTYTYTPDANFHGHDQFTVTVRDGQGGVSTAVVDLSVTPLEDAPTSSTLPSQTSNDGDPVSLDIGAAFADGDGDTLTYAATGLPDGLQIGATTGLISGTLAADASANGPYTVVIQATDGSGLSARQTFTWQVRNTAPVAANDTFTSPADQPLTFDPLLNDVDADGDPLVLTAATATHGTVTLNPDGTLTYEPGITAASFDTVLYTVTDAQGSARTAEVRITLTPPTSRTLVEPAVTEPATRQAALSSDHRTMVAQGAVIAAVNRIQSLHGTPLRDVQQGSIGVVPHTEGPRVNDRVTAILDPRQTGFDTLATEPWIGASLKLLGDTPLRQMPFIVDTEVRRETVQVSFTATGVGRTGSVAEYQVRVANGRPLPAGIQADPQGSVTISRVPGLDKVKLMVRALHTDGGVTEAQLEVDANTGAVRLLGGTEQARPAPDAALLTTDLDRLSSAQDVESEALAVALLQD